MARVLNFHGPSFYECDLCEDYADRVVTDSHTGKDICLNCASSGGQGGLFYRVIQNPLEYGDNLMKLAEEYKLLREDDEDDEEAEAEASV